MDSGVPRVKALSLLEHFILVFDFVTLGLLLVFAGVATVVVAFLLSSKAQQDGTRVKGGGVIMVGPVPIIFGSDAKWASVAIILALVLVVLSLLVGFYAV